MQNIHVDRIRDKTDKRDLDKQCQDCGRSFMEHESWCRRPR